MRVKTKKLVDKRVLVEATATGAEVKTALREIREVLAAQLGLKPDGLHTFEWLAKEQANFDDFEGVVAAQVIESFVPLAIDQTGVTPAFIPQVEQMGKLKENRVFNFIFTITPKPEFELTSYDPVEVSVETPKIPEEQITAKMMDIISGYNDYVKEDAHPLKEGDSCVIDLIAYENGEEIKPLTTGPEGRVYTLNDMLMPPAFDRQLVGMAPGDSKTFDFPAPDLDKDGKEISINVNCTVKILECRAKAEPQLTDEWVSKYMPLYKSVDEMREIVRGELRQTADREYTTKLRTAVVEQLAKRFEGKIADEIYEATQANLVEDIRMQMTQQGVDFDDYVKKQGNMFNVQLMMQTRETLVQGYALDAVYRHAGLTLTEEDLVTWCRTVAPGQNPREMRHNMERSGRGFVMREGAARLKANDWAAAQAKVNVTEE